MTKHNAFWDDLARDLEDPEFLREYVVESVRIDTIDTIVNALDGAREAAGLTKAELARAIQKEPATIRRLLSSDNSNPTLGTLAEVAAALGLRITSRADLEGRASPDHDAFARGPDGRSKKARRAPRQIADTQGQGPCLTHVRPASRSVDYALRTLSATTSRSSMAPSAAVSVAGSTN